MTGADSRPFIGRRAMWVLLGVGIPFDLLLGLMGVVRLNDGAHGGGVLLAMAVVIAVLWGVMIPTAVHLRRLG